MRTAPLDGAASVSEHGFAIIPDVFEAREMATVLDKIERTNPRRTRAGVRHALKYPEIAELAHDRRLTEVASEILVGRAFPYRATLFDKSPEANWLVVWHQDTALPLCERRDLPGWGPWSIKDGILYAHAPCSALSKIVALRVHFDDSAQHNGPLRVLRRTHNIGVLTDAEIEELEHSVAPVECTVARGGVIAMRPLIVHSSSKSQTDAPRRVLHVEYATEKTVAPGLELAIA